MAAAPIPNFSLKDISKWPLAFLCVLLTWLVYEFKFSNTESTTKTVDTLQFRVLELERQVKRKDTTVAFWQAKYIMEVEKNASYFKSQDSANREALEQPAKDILKIVKRNSHE